MNLLQGFDLRTAENLASIARTCNEVFQMKIQEVFTERDFEPIAAERAQFKGFFGTLEPIVGNIHVTCYRDYLNEAAVPRPRLLEKLAEANGLQYHTDTKTDEQVGSTTATVTLPGCTVSWICNPLRNQQNDEVLRFAFTATLTPQLFGTTAPVLDQWREQAVPDYPLELTLQLPDLATESEPHRRTTLLNGTDVHWLDATRLEFDGFAFELPPGGRCLRACPATLTDPRLVKCLQRLLDLRVLYKVPPPDPTPWLPLRRPYFS